MRLSHPSQESVDIARGDHVNVDLNSQIETIHSAMDQAIMEIHMDVNKYTTGNHSQRDSVIHLLHNKN